MNLLNLLFESKVDSWIQTQRNKQQFSASETIEIENLLNKFQKNLESIFFKDSTQYDLDLLKVTIESIKLARFQNIKSPTIKWLTKQIFENPNLTIENIKEDYIPILNYYEKNKEKIEKPLESFETITDLTYFIQDLNKSSENNQEFNDSSKDIILEKDDWILAMPSSTENSCDLGSGTTWCTARTNSQNLFLSYVGRMEQNIILFYVLKQGGNPRKDPFAKMSVGFVEGEPRFGGGDGTITVNASNQGLSEEQFRNILGNELANEFLAKMKEVSGNISGKHPAKEELSRIVKNYDLFIKKAETFKNQDTLDEFFNVAIEYENINPQIFEYIIGKTKDQHIVRYIASALNAPQSLLKNFATHKDEHIRQSVASNPSLPVEFFQTLLTDRELNVRFALAYNPNIPKEFLDVLVFDRAEYVRNAVAGRKKTSIESLRILSTDRFLDVRMTVAGNPNIPEDLLRTLEKDAYLRRGAAKNLSLPKDLMDSYVASKDQYVREALARNKKLPEDLLRILAADINSFVQKSALKSMSDRNIKEAKKNFSFSTILF